MNRFLSLLLVLCACSCARTAQNFHQVDKRLWRSEQPISRNITQLKENGITHLVSLRRFHNDDHLNDHFRCSHVPMRAGDLTERDLLDALMAIGNGSDTTLVHCWHGADRTGAVVAAYRMVVQKWDKERAIEEMHQECFGHHAETFPEITSLLSNFDVPAMRAKYNELASRKDQLADD